MKWKISDFLKFKPNNFLISDIDVESISSVSDDDDDSSLSDSDYIIVPLPECFNINKPLTRSMMSSYTSERADDDEIHKTLSVGKHLTDYVETHKI